MKKKRVLHILWDGNLGGVQRYVEKVSTSAYWKNTENYVLILANEGEVINSHGKLNVEVICLNISSKFQIKKCYSSLIKLIKKFKIDLIHCHCDSLFILTQLRFLKECKVIYTEHGDSFVRTERQFVSELLWKINGVNWNKILLNSEHTRKLFLQKFPFLKPFAEVLSNPLLEDVESSIREQSPNFSIGTLGRLSHVKGNDMFIKAAKCISEKYPQASFHLYGDGEERGNLENLVNELNLSEKFQFHGFTSNPIDKMRDLDCLVVPSRAESFGLVAVEALAVGTPVAAFEGTGVADFVVDHINGALAEMGNVQQLADAVSYVLKNSDNWRRLSMNGMETVREHFSLKKHIGKLETIYSQVLHEEQQEETA